MTCLQQGFEELQRRRRRRRGSRSSNWGSRAAGQLAAGKEGAWMHLKWLLRACHLPGKALQRARTRGARAGAQGAG
jgi:hypothetical protein